MRMLSVSRLSVCLAVALLAVGCGPSTMTVDPIAPNLTLQKDPRATNKEIKIAVEEFQAARNQKREHLAIGEAKTGFFNSSTTILTSESPEQMVTAALRDAFTQTGFHLVERHDANYVVAGQVEDFWVDEYATGVSLEYAKAFVRYDIAVKDNQGNTLWGTTKEHYETSGQCWDATAQGIPTLTTALSRTITSIFEDQSFWQALSK